jgi:hypothetical protein
VCFSDEYVNAYKQHAKYTKYPEGMLGVQSRIFVAMAHINANVDDVARSYQC